MVVRKERRPVLRYQLYVISPYCRTCRTMRTFPNNTILIEPGDCFPVLPERIERLYLDVESTSKDPNKAALNPWHGSWVAGVSLTWDNHPYAYYLPIAHNELFCGKGNLDRESVTEWLQYVLSISNDWINHNIKIDAHWLYNDLGIDNGEANTRLICTLALAKIINSDLGYRGGYGLDSLSYIWLMRDIGQYELAMKPYLSGAKNKDYGRIPTDIMAMYAGQDVLTNRDLYLYEEQNCPDSCRDVWNTEIQVTQVLVDMERKGIQVDPDELMVSQILLTRDLCQLWSEIAEEIGWQLNPSSSDQCEQMLIKQYGLPVVMWTNKNKKSEDDDEEGNPSFGKDALEKYLAYPQAPRIALKKIIEYRKKAKLLTAFIEPYQELNKEGVIHSNYNQTVRTGRMSCRAPNMQQLNKAAKALFKPRPGNGYLVADYKQIEFRFIVHYIKDAQAIRAYRENPDTDFHQWMAELCDIPRQAAKRMNFLIGYGGGKEKTKEALMQVDEIIATAHARVQALIEQGVIYAAQMPTYFNKIVQEIALMAYNTYHARLPTLKAESRRVAGTAKMRYNTQTELGYVVDIYGRRRHLPPQRYHIGFNSICQQSAADLMKERMVALHDALRYTDITIVATVHDSVVLEGPIEQLRDPRTLNDVCWILENPTVLPKLRVPIKVDCGFSTVNWANADADANKVTPEQVHPPEDSPFSHLTGAAVCGTMV